MTDIAIRVENLSKQYRIGGPQARYKTIRESLTEAVQTPFRRLSSVIRGQPSVVSRLIAGEAMIVLPEQGHTKVLNEIGSRIWALADGTRTLESIVETICWEYEVALVQAQADVLAFVEELI